jgi:hypothetical protein
MVDEQEPGTAMLQDEADVLSVQPANPASQAPRSQARIKDTVDLDTVRDDPAGAVHQALEPAHVSVIKGMTSASRLGTGRPACRTVTG